jgi:polyisoprenoid-binding protein YceI
MKRILCLVATLAVFASPVWAATYEIDAAHSSVSFKVGHLVGNVRGQFDKFSGTVDYDEKNIEASKVNVQIEAASINTGNADRDKHLRGEDFFDIAKYPDITFVSKRADAQKLVGDLTMHGVTKEIEIPYTMGGLVKDPWGKQRLGGSGALTIDRRDFGIKYDPTGLTIKNDVKIELEIEATLKA